MSLPIDDFLRLRAILPVVDVRSESEFENGHIPGAVNIPILSNAQRTEVGTLYKQKGQHDAVTAGLRLVSPRIERIIAHAGTLGNEILVHCWRGGLRSDYFSRFVNGAGIRSRQLSGGYKMYRAKAAESFGSRLKLVVLAGATGSGKSEILRELKRNGEQVLDLEMLASHKGSVFGGLSAGPQPKTQQFQNLVFEEIIGLDHSKRIWVEDESISIGKIFVPTDLWKQMQQSPMIEITAEKSARVTRLVNEYGGSDKEEFLVAMTKIIKRLGGQHFNAAKEKLLIGDMAAVIEILLVYYDKAYTLGLEKNAPRINHCLSWDGCDATEITASLMSL